MNPNGDVVVAGGGPCGCFTAFNLAKRGVRVTVFEEHKEIGVPPHCAGHLSIKGLERLGLWSLPSEVVENKYRGAVFHSPSGKQFRVRFSSPVTCSVNRTLFDKSIAEMAEKAGATVSRSARVDSLIIDDDCVRGVAVKRNGSGVVENVSAKVVVDAEGIGSRLLRQAGLQGLNRGMIVNAVETEVENIKDTESDMVEVFLGKQYASGFYGWLMPKTDGKSKLGLAADSGNPEGFLQKLMMKHPTASPRLRNARILRKSFHPITLGGPLSKTCANGLLAVGDAASQVKPTTGGGVIFGMTCSKVAAQVANEALQKNDFSEGFLAKYQNECERLLGFDAWFMLRIRRMLNTLSDAKIESAVDFCSKAGLDKTLRNLGDLDLQGRSFVRMLGKPRVMPVLFYLFLLYLSTNP